MILRVRKTCPDLFITGVNSDVYGILEMTGFTEMMRVEKAFGICRVLTEEYFSLDLIRTDSMVMLPPMEEFGMLTVTEGKTELRFPGASMKLKAGETVLLPKQSPEMALVGCGAAALAMPVSAPLFVDEPILADESFGED